MAERILTAPELLRLAEVVRDIQAGCRVRWMRDDGETMDGVLRYLDGPDGSPRPEDVRDCYVRVTLLTGLETWVPLAELALKSTQGAYISKEVKL